MHVNYAITHLLQKNRSKYMFRFTALSHCGSAGKGANIKQQTLVLRALCINACLQCLQNLLLVED